MDEQTILNKKYEETLKTLNDSHHNRMKALTNQHQLATETLISQFTQEINMMKASHKAGLDRLLNDHSQNNEKYEEIIKCLKEENTGNIEKIRKKHEKELKDLHFKLNQHFLIEKQRMVEQFEREKQDMAESVGKERDSQVKMVISKIYEENRKEWKMQEGKLTEEIRVLRFQLESQKLKVKAQEDFVRKSKEGFDLQSEDFNWKGKEWSVENIDNLSIFCDKDKNERAVQTEMREGAERGVQTEEVEEVGLKVREIQVEFDSILDSITVKAQSCILNKNRVIAECQSKISNLLLQNKELSALIKSLNT